MKQQVIQGTNGEAGCREGLNYADWAELEAWLGYEFWSAQVEAEMEPEALEQQFSPGHLALCRKESESDVRPF